MIKQELIEKFYYNHQELIHYINSLADDKFIFRQNGKWTAGQQLSHIYLCLKFISQAISSKGYIEQKFGKINRKNMYYDKVIDEYKLALESGGKAPEHFLPQQVDVNNKIELTDDLFELLKTIRQQLEGYSDIELDTFVLPHPLLGNLTIREMLYLMTYHATHHHKQNERNLESHFSH
ncbi:MAG: DinB family protein [Chitinophagales bacterium]|nr:DinB family protein [Chitinophagales bacterium]